MPLVLDASVVLAWVLEEQQAPDARNVLDKLQTDTAVVPSIWPVEVANALLVSQRRGRLPADLASQAVLSILALEIEVRLPNAAVILMDVRGLAMREGLTVYDASYLDLAMREGLPLATLDNDLRDAAERVGVSLIS